MTNYVYIQSEKPSSDNNFHGLYTVGFYAPDGTWHPESDFNETTAAAERVAFLNGSGVVTP